MGECRQIKIDRTKPLADDPGTGHNRWHPDVPPIMQVGEGEVVELDTRDACDGQIDSNTTPEHLAALDGSRIHPLTGPIAVSGAEPGDLLEVSILEVRPDDQGYTMLHPDYGILREHFQDPYLVHWNMQDGFAVSDEISSVRVPAAPFMGTVGVAPSSRMLDAYIEYETKLAAEMGTPAPTEPQGVFPKGIENGLRTIPPRDNGGNIDVAQLTAGSVLRLPVFVEGALFSTGDAHFAQGDNECCTAIEMNATLKCHFKVLKGVAERQAIRDPQIVLPGHANETRRPYFGTTGQSFSRDGQMTSNDLTRASEHALLNMIAHISANYGYSAQQGAVICSVAANLKVSQAANHPNFIVSAFLPTDIFESE